MVKMKKLTEVNGLKKGDVVLMKEVRPISKYGELVDVEFEHKFEIVRDNKKTYSCIYIEGAFKGIGFKWIKGSQLGNLASRSYWTEGEL